MMDEAEFWEMIDGSRRGIDVGACANGDAFQEEQIGRLRAALQVLGAEACEQFQLRLLAASVGAFRADLWGAASWIGACDEDTFLDFRGNLVSLGRAMYLQAVGNADNLADICGRTDVPDLFREGFSFLAYEAFRKLTGKRMELSRFWDLPDYPRQPEELAGEKWDYDDREQVARRLPRLVRKFPRAD